MNAYPTTLLLAPNTTREIFLEVCELRIACAPSVSAMPRISFIN